MCGIAGYLGLPIAEDERLPLLRRMCDTIAYRGPDDDGYFADAQVGLGMRRLSIIDLQGGKQPISSPDERVHIIFNGEIYNYRHLRAEHAAAGYPFKTETDTEVILAAYLRDGPDCLHALNGMFAVAIWDEGRDALFLGRDRMGIKPLYYYWDGQHFLFASEIKALLVSDFAKRQVNPQAVWDYLSFRYVPQPESIWQFIYKLPPGYYLRLTPKRVDARPVRYWDIPYPEQPEKMSDPEIDRQFAELFLDSVQRRLIADVPVGILLSGGLDSSSVAAAVSETHNARLDSFSVAFEGAAHIDETPFARQVAQHVGTQHYEIVINEQQFVDFLPDFVRYTDEPNADLASVPLYYVSHLARQYVKVVLSGEGADEILAGYDFDYHMGIWQRRRAWQRLPGWLRRSAFKGVAARLMGATLGQDGLDEIPYDMRLWETPRNMTYHRNSEQKQKLFSGETAYSDSAGILRAEVKRVRSGDPLNQWLYLFCQSWLVEDLLMKADRMSMANSLELRTPFLDYRLVEWAAKGPIAAKVGPGPDGKLETKRALRRFARSRLPVEIIERSKMGFPVPLYEWVANGLKPWAYDLLDSSDTQVTTWLDPQAVRQELAAGTSERGTLAERHLLWDLLILELWSREWLKE